MTPSPGFQKASVLLLFFAVSKRRELRSKIVKSEKNVKIATPLVGPVFYSVCPRKSSEKESIYVEPAFGKTQNVAFYEERAAH